MVIRAQKKCNICANTIAEKRGLFYRTIIPYITLNENTRRFGDEWVEKVHICDHCLDELKYDIKRRLDNVR